LIKQSTPQGGEAVEGSLRGGTKEGLQRIQGKTGRFKG